MNRAQSTALMMIGVDRTGCTREKRGGTRPTHCCKWVVWSCLYPDLVTWCEDHRTDVPDDKEQSHRSSSAQVWRKPCAESGSVYFKDGRRQSAHQSPLRCTRPLSTERHSSACLAQPLRKMSECRHLGNRARDAALPHSTGNLERPRCFRKGLWG